MVWAAIGAGVSIASGLLGAKAARKQARNAKLLANENIRLSREETAENQRRMGIEKGRALSQGQAAAGASNLLMSGSTKQFMAAMDQQWNSDMSWERRRADIEQKRLRLGGQATANQIRAGGTASLLNSAASAAGYLAKLGD